MVVDEYIKNLKKDIIMSSFIPLDKLFDCIGLNVPPILVSNVPSVRAHSTRQTGRKSS